MASVYIQLPAISVSTTGLATTAKQDLQITQETAINTNLGTDITTPTAMPSGGAGVRGWLSAIWTKLNGSLAVTGTFWQATQPISGTVTSNIGTTNGLALDSSLTTLNAKDFATQTTLALVKTKTDNLDVALSTISKDVSIGSLTETAPGTDTASSGLNGRLQRVAQRLTSLIALFPASLGSKAAASAFAVTDSTEDIARMGIITEAAPASDTASSGLNGRLQRIAQRITSLIAQIPASLGQTTKSASMSVTIASDQTQALTSAQSLTLDGTTAQTFTAPANAKWVKVMASSDNTIDLKVAFGGTTATATVGTELQPGRAEDFVGVSSISVICKSAITAHAVFITWSV